MLTTKDAIEKRRSIRKFTSEPVADEYINELIESARLAPSGCNSQPWRFKIVKDAEIKKRLAEAAFGQTFICSAPVVLICCADINAYIEGSISSVKEMAKWRVIDEGLVDILHQRAENMKNSPAYEIGPKAALHVAIAIEHIVLRALDFGLGTCWVRLFEEEKVKNIFAWKENLYVVTLLPIGYPAESPMPRKRLPINDLILK